MTTQSGPRFRVGDNAMIVKRFEVDNWLYDEDGEDEDGESRPSDAPARLMIPWGTEVAINRVIQGSGGYQYRISVDFDPGYSQGYTVTEDKLGPIYRGQEAP